MVPRSSTSKDPGVPIDMMKNLLSQQAKYGPSHSEFIIIHPEKTMVDLPIFLLEMCTNWDQD
jgi:hypothetical protein